MKDLEEKDSPVSKGNNINTGFAGSIADNLDDGGKTLLKDIYARIVSNYDLNINQSILENYIINGLKHDKNMQENYAGAMYFVGFDPNDIIGRVSGEVASEIYFDFCHKLDAFGAYQIILLLLEKKIPDEIVRFYSETRNGGADELFIIQNLYKTNREHISLLPEQMISMCKEIYALSSNNTEAIIDICLAESDNDSRIKELKLYFQLDGSLEGFGNDNDSEI